MKATSFAEEEENCLRMFLLIRSVATKAVRILFDNKVPPVDLQQILQNKKSTLTALRYRFINQSQWDLIYPQNVQQIPQSSQFDITLMICLLRNLKLVNEPAGGFDRLPGNIDHSEGADLARIKYHRNKMAHRNDNILGTSEFQKAWLELSDAINRLTNGVMKEECDRIKVKNLDQNTEKLKEDMKDFKKEIYDLKEDIKDLKAQNVFHSSMLLSTCIGLEHVERRQSVNQRTLGIDQNTYEQWMKDDIRFVETSAVKYILKQLEKKNIITVTGIPGIGKTATLRHVALYYKKNGYEIIPVESPLDIVNQLASKIPKIFVIDDTCGESLMNISAVDMWLQHEAKIRLMLYNQGIKVIASSVLYIFNERQFQKITLLNRCSCNLSDKRFARNVEENVKIFENHLQINADVLQIIQSYNQENFSAILPFTSLIRHSDDEIHSWLTNPKTYFSIKMDEITADKRKSCTLFMLLVTNGHISDSYFKSDQNQEVLHRFENILEEFGINRGTPKRFIQDNLDAFQDTYVKKVGPEYFPINSSIFDELCVYFCEHMLERVITYADSKLISQKLHLQLVHRSSQTDAVLIKVPEVLETTFFDRIIRDVMRGEICNVFRGHQMQNPLYRFKLKGNIMKLECQSRKKFLNMKDKEDKHISLLYLVCKLGYIDFALLILECVDDINGFSDFLPLNAACSNGFINIAKLLIKHGVDATKYDANGLNGLLEACKGGYINIVKLMLKNKAKINEKNVDGQTSLMIACGNGKTDIAKFLLSEGAFVNTRCNLGFTPLIMACLNNCIDIVDLLLYKSDVNISTRDKWTPLMVACQINNAEVVEWLIANGAFVNCSSITETTPLIIACSHGHTEIAIKLIHNGANPDTSNQFGDTALHGACMGGHLDIAEFLIKEGVDINKKDMIGCSPLANAARCSKRDIVKLLLQKGAKTNIIALKSRSAVTEACLGGDKSIVKLLIDNGTIMNYQSYNEFTPLMAACLVGNKDMVQYLIQRGAKINETDRRGWNALFSACMFNNTEVVKLLIENQACTNAKNHLGITPLMCASFYENIAVVGLLRQFGGNLTTTNKFGHSVLSIVSRTGSESFLNWVINNLSNTALINQKDKAGLTPLMHACSVGHLDKANLLIKKGADINISDVNDWTCVMYASEQGNEILVDLLLHKGQGIDDIDINGCSALSIASYLGYLNIMEILLLNGACVNICDKQKWTPLMWACRGQHLNAVKLLLDYDADINIKSEDEKTPLQWVSEAGENEMVDIIIPPYITDIEKDETNLWVLLMWSARIGKTEIVRKCILQGVNVNKANNDGITPLIISTYNAHFEIVRLLVSNNAIVNKLDNQGWSALRWADQFSFNDISKYLTDNGASTCITGVDLLPVILWCCRTRSGFAKLLRSLIEQAGVDVNCVDSQGRSPLFLSCIAKNYEQVLSLIENGADLNQADNRQRTPIMEVCRDGNVEIYQLLMRYKVILFPADNNGNTCLIEAVKGGNSILVNDLIENGAEISAANKRLWTAREEARWRGYTEIVKTVESKPFVQ